jgi:hypothetical protein
MRSETKTELSTWAQYFLIALLAELGAGMALFPHQQGSDINLYGYFQKRVEPHLYVWLLIFMILSTIKVLSRLASKKAETETGSS